MSEIISIGAVFPFLAVLLNPDSVYSNQYFQFLIKWFDIQSSSGLILPLTIAFIIAALFSGILRLTLIWLTTKISFLVGGDLAYKIYQISLHQEYREHINRSSSVVIDAIQNKTNTVIYLVLMPVLNLISAFILFLIVLTALFFLNPLITFVTLFIFGFIYLTFVFAVKRRLVIDSENISSKSILILKKIQEGLGGIRDILLDGTQNFFLKIFQETDSEFRAAQARSTFVGAFPRYVMEILGMIVLSLLAYLISISSSNIGSAIPILGVAALGAQRLLPILQQAYNAWTNIKVGDSSLIAILKLLQQPLSSKLNDNSNITPISFNNTIELRDVWFRYSHNAQWVLNSINIEINKGSRIGFMGETGGGKSTLLDIIMALLEPSEGSLLVDGKKIGRHNKSTWQKRIAHVPQAIYLSDGTFSENIAFGVPLEDIDHRRVVEAASRAQLLSFINGLTDKFQTKVGERGVNLSGGQRQRIGIARALYKKADVLIFDEATSALDSFTESAVMKSIEGLDPELTILLIAHRLSTLAMCETIYQLKDGNITVVQKLGDTI